MKIEPASGGTGLDLMICFLDALPRPSLLVRGDTIHYASPAFCAEFRFAADALAGMQLADLVDGGDLDLVLARAASSALSGGRVGGVEVGMHCGDGAPRRVDLAMSGLVCCGEPAVLMSVVDVTGRHQAEAENRRLHQLLAHVVEGAPVPIFVIDEHHVVTHWNRACAQVTGTPAADQIGCSRQWAPFYPSERPTLADLIVDGDIERAIGLYGEKKIRRSSCVAGAYEAEDFFPHFGVDGRWLYFTAAPLRDADGRIVGAIETLQDVSDRRRAEAALLAAREELEHLVERRTEQLALAKRQLEEDIERREAAEQELRRRYAELAELNERLSAAQQQLMQSEKLASIGQLAAGVAHEINNPIGYVQANIGMLEKYLSDLLVLLDAYEEAETSIEALERLERESAGGLSAPPRPSGDVVAKLRGLKRDIDLEFLREDIPALMSESREGVARVRRIVQDLRDFSRADSSQDWQLADLHAGLDSTLNIAANEIKYRADVVKAYGSLPPVECLPSQLNQVFMNLLVNAAQAIPEDRRGTITVRTGSADEHVWIEIADDGKGIAPEHCSRIFDPFFTTKPVGRGTGLGLSLSYGIVSKHGGRIEVSSAEGAGSTFRVVLPIRRGEGDSQ